MAKLKEPALEIRATLVLNRADVERLRGLADGRSLSLMVRRAIRAWLVKVGK
jgi:hypothetical protein